MSVPLTEFVIETIIRDGLGDLKANPDKLDDLFSRFTQAHFLNQFGQTQIDAVKTYLQENQIRIVQSWALVPTSMPCISIQMVESNESEEDQQFSNMLPEVDSDKEPEVYADELTFGTYSSQTGKLQITSDTDLSEICPGLIFVDSADNEFIIGFGNSNLAGNKYINIGKNVNPDLSGEGKIVSSVDFSRMDRRMIRLREVISLGVHASDNPHLTKLLYYIILYIIKTRQIKSITRGLHLDRIEGSIFNREDEFSGEHIISRYINVHCLTEFDWDEAEVNLIDCFDLTAKIETNTGIKTLPIDEG